MAKISKTIKMAGGGTAKSCWPGYSKMGTKNLNGKIVNNCVKKAKDGTSLKLVDKTKNPGLSKLPTPVRNKMGYQKSGGSTPAWTRKEGKNPTGGLNAKGRASYNRANPGSNLKAPQPQGGARKRSFCARMSGVKGPATKPNGEPTRKTLALRKWKC